MALSKSSRAIIQVIIVTMAGLIVSCVAFFTVPSTQPAAKSDVPNVGSAFENMQHQAPTADRVPASVNTGGKWILSASRSFGTGICSIGSGYVDHGIVVSVVEGSVNKFGVMFHRPSWRIPINRQIDVDVTLDGQPVFRLEGKATQPYLVDVELSGAEAVAFLTAFKIGKVMTLRFADTTEPLWTAPLNGSAAALDALDTCMADWQRLSR